MKIPLRYPLISGAFALAAALATTVPAGAVVIGFETAESYSTTGGNSAVYGSDGDLGGQGVSPNAWSAPAATTGLDKLRVVSNPVVGAENSSSQAIKLFDTTSTTSALYRIFSPSLGATFSSTTSVLSFQYQFLYETTSATTTSSLRFGIGEMGGGKQVMRVEFLSNGTLKFNAGTDANQFVKDGSGGTFTASTNQWITISGVLDYATNSYTLSVNGVDQSFNSSVSLGFFDTSNKTQVFNLQAMGSTGSNYASILFDNINYSAIPEPSGVAVFAGIAACAGALTVRRRRPCGPAQH